MVDKGAFLAHFEKYLADLLSDDKSVLSEVARYCALDGGKRVRPVCVYLGALAAGGNCGEKELLALAAGVELVHCYSLVHDDLPCMDDGAIRRGKPSAHIAFGETNAVLGGDALLSYAFDHLAKKSAEFGAGFALAAAQISSAAVDMAHGQALELAGIKDAREYLDMCAKKTGALILGALRAGAIAAGAEKNALENIDEYGKAVGLCFQLSDDLIDGDGAVPLIGEETVRAKLENQRLRAEFAARDFDPSLTAFVNTIANRTM